MGKKYISDSFVKVGGTTFEYLMADGSTSIVVSDGIPTAPLEITSSGYVNEGTTNFVSLSEWFKFRYTYPLINKQYPEYTELLNAYTIIPSARNISSVTIIDTVTFNNIDAVTNANSVSHTNIRKVIYPTLKYMLSTYAVSSPTSGVFDEISMPVIKGIFGQFTIPSSTTLTTINFPLLEVGSFINSNISLQTLVFPEALHLSITDIATASAMTQFSFPKVKFISLNIGTTGKPSLTTINLPVVEFIGTFALPTISTSLTTVNFGSSLKNCNTNITTTSNSLTQASVDNILISLANLNGTNGTFSYNSRTVTLTGGAATPSATGLAAKATLQARGCTVTTN